MENSFAQKLERRARYLLPAETTMMVECWADGGDRMCAALLRHIQTCGMMEEDLCPEPYETVIFDDRVLLRCAGCDRANAMPKIIGVGWGETEEEARQNALYALTLPEAREEKHWGEGPVRVQVSSCIFNRVAYAML